MKIRELVRMTGEPLGDPAWVPTALLAERAPGKKENDDATQYHTPKRQSLFESHRRRRWLTYLVILSPAQSHLYPVSSLSSSQYRAPMATPRAKPEATPVPASSKAAPKARPSLRRPLCDV